MSTRRTERYDAEGRLLKRCPHSEHEGERWLVAADHFQRGGCTNDGYKTYCKACMKAKKRSVRPRAKELREAFERLGLKARNDGDPR